MKIGILTQPIGFNYGGILQNYALQKVLKIRGVRPITLNRTYESTHCKIKIGFSNIKNDFLNLCSNKLYISSSINKSIFEEPNNFINKYIEKTIVLDKTQKLSDYCKLNNFDAVIVGSDQVWRPSYSPNIYNYFLDFLSGDKSIRKIAYASSFGTSEWEFSKEETERCKALVKEFDAVSVREESGVKLCRDCLNTDAELVLDPTFLISKEDYIKIANLAPVPKRNGLFSYILDENDKILDIIINVSNILQLNHFTNQPKWRRNNKEDKALEELKHPSLEGWLKAFDDADFVVTNSFHGTVFCIIFNKPFLTIVNEDRGASRFYSLLGQFDLTNRLINVNDDIGLIVNILRETIDFNSINAKLEQLKNFSMNFLIKNL